MMSRQFWLTLAVILIIFVIVFPISPAGRQAINMGRARRHLPTLQAQIANDPRFVNVHLGVGTADDGILLVYGSVANTEDEQALRVIVEQSNPPTAFRIFLRQIPHNELEQVE